MKKKLHVLIVDDSQVDSTYLDVLLQRLTSWQVFPAFRRTGAEALNWLSTNDPDLIFVDYRLPAHASPGLLHGPDLISRFRETGCSAGIILVTGAEGEAAILRAWRSGADDYIQKSELSLDTLNRSMHQTLHKVSTGRALQQAVDSLSEAKRELEIRVQERTAQLSEALGQLDTITMAAHDAIVMLDPQDKIIFWNPAAERIFGYDALEILGREFGQLVDQPELWGALRQDIAGLRRAEGDGGNRMISETEARRKNGESFIMEGSFVAILNKDAWFVVAILRDVTHHKEAVAALKQAKEEAEQATSLKDKFVSLVAHDLRGPFTTILGFLELLESDPNNPLSEKQRSFLGWVVESSQKMVQMIDELLNISRLKTGQIIPEPRFLDARFTMEKALGNFRPQAKAKRIQLINETPDNHRVFADPTLFGEVLQNLISNAVKFTRPGGSITLSVSPDSPPAIVIADSGVGISKKRLPRLFKLEEKTSTTGTAGERGTGFGLPFSQEIMRAHGGRLAVTSEPDKGSRFQIRLPHVDPRVLVVDDDPDFRKLVITYLKRIRIKAGEAVSGKQGLARLKRGGHHLVICDVIMPGMSGFEVLAQLRADPKTQNLPVILMTADDSIQTRETAFLMGANDFINKPISASDLLPRVRHIIG